LHEGGRGVDAAEIAEGSGALCYKSMVCRYKYLYAEQITVAGSEFVTAVFMHSSVYWDITQVYYDEIRPNFRRNISRTSPASTNKRRKKPRFNCKSNLKLSIVVKAYLMLVGPNKLIF
jgi:hypothetical protein